jgi:hypothetical protein
MAVQMKSDRGNQNKFRPLLPARSSSSAQTLPLIRLGSDDDYDVLADRIVGFLRVETSEIFSAQHN